MKVKLERDWASMAIRIWFYEPREGGGTVMRLTGPDMWENVEVEQGARLPDPSLTLPEELLKGLVREASNVLPPSDATTEHLSDTRAIRDRLLAMIEKRGLR